MSVTLAAQKVLKGGEFLIADLSPAATFSPEDFNEEQLMVKQTVEDFIRQDIVPNLNKIEKQEDGIAVKLLDKMAELGLLGSHMPESFGGLQMDTNTNTLICDVMGGSSGSFTVSFAAHTGIGMLPILYYGTEEQKAKWLPRLITGELKAAYCLTEPGSGSDAMGAKTTAVLDGDEYVLNGQKMWISNAGFADVFIVFAQVDGDKFTGFIVPRHLEGLTLGAEEEKLGIKGSSTRQVFFENVRIPADSYLGEIGKGHLIAFNVLNVGRFKLHALSVGGSKRALTIGINYANERVQFGQTIANFGAIKYKIAEAAIQIFAGESALYRVSQLIQDMNKSLEAEGKTFAEAKRLSAEEYAIECALLKFIGSELLDYTVDEVLQIHGGMGYSEETLAPRMYRDARINRIYEGTNEINRLLSVDMLLRRALKGAIDIVGPAWNVQKELAQPADTSVPAGEYGAEIKAVANFKKAILMVVGAAAKAQMDGRVNLKDEQEVLMNVADMLADLLNAESTLLRLQRLRITGKGRQPQALYDAILQVLFHDVNARIAKNGLDAIASFAEENLLDTFAAGLRRFTQYPIRNVKALRRTVADHLIAQNAYEI
ncbi:acyl-CoA dehydrogenase family protein [Neolewinella lacunae]|uniref:Acyl-CoA dehydrogenase family protein n=1 Tax=Neolewinella lacunae TaxID=1517758 RepID=A0A923PPX2_9BACT|nr:acyl-CoA dehydrogenase family protein [Neolewinella lacunae]MBC6995626.1 acyl-CoA dehydrogenase family protein [Neolewinella lacunae]MDN3635543.1 acyl-CoA dehydrogenase family protein [Neolewinella lacunae]